MVKTTGQLQGKIKSVIGIYYILNVLLVVKVFARAPDKIFECPAFRGYVAKESFSQKQTPHIRRNCKRTVFLIMEK